MVRLARDADVLIHECTFPEAFIEHRRKSKVGTFSHTSPAELGKIATRADVKSLVATHIGHFESLNPVIHRASAHHLPIDLMGPHMMDDVVRDIRKYYGGPLRMAHDLMRIDV
jgi:ribonuclease Z